MSSQIYDEKIPQGWEVVKLGDVAKITMGQSPDGATYSNSPSKYILIQGNADIQNGFVKPRIWTTQITKIAYVGNIIMSVRAPAGAIAKTEYDAVIGRGVAAIEGNDFIYHILIKMDKDGYWDEFSCGSTFDSLKSYDIFNAKILMPKEKVEQERIAQVLGDMDDLISAKCELLDKKRAIKQGAAQQLLTPKPHWHTTTIGEICEISAGGDLNRLTFSPIKTDKFLNPIYSNAVSDNGLYGYSSDFDYEGNFITVTARGYIGYAAARNGKFCSIGRLLNLKPKFNISCFYVAEYINHFIDFVIESTGVPQLTAPQISKYKISLPKDKTEQEKIAQILSDMDDEISALQDEIEKLKMIKQGAMDELLSGKIRLKG